MNFSVIPTERFKKDAKRLVKKYPSLKQELAEINNLLTRQPDSGTPLGHDTYKIRIAIKSKNKGKSGGARLITYLVTADKEVYLLTIYDKSEFTNIDDKTLQAIISSVAK